MKDKPNRYDDAYKEYFQSKMFKTIIKTVAIIMGVIFLCVCLIMLALAGYGYLVSS